MTHRDQTPATLCAVLGVSLAGAALITVVLLAADMVRGCVRDEPCAAKEERTAE